jgi:hypothetical protein
MKIKLLLSTVVMCALLPAAAQENTATDKQALLAKRIPEWVKPIITKAGIADTYEISDTINPFYLEGDFNGDKQEDIAFFIVNKLDGKAGMLVIHRQTNLHYIFGAGKDFGMGDDMSWVKIWSVHREKAIKSFAGGKKRDMPLKFPAIRIVKTEAISAYFYWTGKKYKTYNQLM